MKLLFFTVAVVIAITILSTDAWFVRRVNRHQRFRHSSSSSSSSTKRINRPRHNTRRVNRPRHNTRNQCLHLCESSLLKEKLIDAICPDPCEGITCSTNGVCERGRCNCLPGYTGCDCESEIDPCRNVNCQNNGRCEEGNCTCPDGFGGQFCEDDQRCNTVMCNNGGVCVSGACNCTAEYTGDSCDTLVCTTLPGSRCDRIDDMRVNDLTGNEISSTLSLVACKMSCLGDNTCLGFSHLITSGNLGTCTLFNTDVSSNLGASDAVSGICTACVNPPQ